MHSATPGVAADPGGPHLGGDAGAASHSAQPTVSGSGDSQPHLDARQHLLQSDPQSRQHQQQLQLQRGAALFAQVAERRAAAQQWPQRNAQGPPGDAGASACVRDLSQFVRARWTRRRVRFARMLSMRRRLQPTRRSSCLRRAAPAGWWRRLRPVAGSAPRGPRRATTLHRPGARRRRHCAGQRPREGTRQPRRRGPRGRQQHARRRRQRRRRQANPRRRRRRRRGAEADAGAAGQGGGATPASAAARHVWRLALTDRPPPPPLRAENSRSCLLGICKVNTARSRARSHVSATAG